ncbi:GrpB-like predicted nucleotidyltransferase (UPF0157 family) [Alkalihalobacillus xiaoxiensis]|uniref:GrpB-like predicted nucleotidyltransferase (UPF0157 family) n=1 Tax=Shouchella xiaoxiensis TaxID=766895 RepID=A0ABS2STL9_9BACI|nr:GrpB family protein [Shouchella xiaoxiensis]MBM7838814.1 GrpB-like predicted nucleotidyltransferase (UPF0157 family) [Shouchella xiaoxiensis]
MDVRLTDYTDLWAHSFTEEAKRLQSLFGDELIRIEHFGSTAVPGSKAKPVVDMIVLVQDINRIDLLNDTMKFHGYDIAGEWGIPGRRLFRKGWDKRSHHIHVYQSDHPEVDRHLLVRDFLRAHPKEVDAYNQLKVGLVALYPQTKEYSKAKKPYVQALERRALIWAKDHSK